MLNIHRMRFSDELQPLVGCLICSFIGCSYYAIPLTVVAALICILRGIYTNYVAIWIATLLVLTYIPAWESKALRCSWIFRSIAKYFDTEIFKEGREEDYAKKNYLALLFPHGVISFGGLSAATLDVPDHGPTAVASILLKFPVLKQIFSIFGTISSDPNSIKLALKTRNVYLYPGGVAELFLSSRDEEKSYFDHRKGCLRLAMEANVNIVVVYLFGNTEMFDIASNSFLKKLSRQLRFSFVFFWGRFYLPIPYRTKVFAAVSPPICVPHKINPTSEEVDAVHRIVKSKIVHLFETYKTYHPLYKDKSLIFV